MGSFLSELARGTFGVSMAVTMCLAALVCKVWTFLPSSLLSKKAREGISLKVMQAAWRLSLLLSPWMRIRAHPDFAEHMRAFMADMAANDSKTDGLPAFLLGNHTSFFDTILTVCKLPVSMVSRCRTYMGAHLFKLPIVSTLCRCAGHFPVYYASDAYGSFSVDKVKMAKVQTAVDEHISGGGLLAFFPEGQMNKTPDVMCDFRYGGFEKALQFDARLWLFVSYNLPESWPMKAQLGGLPFEGSYDIRPCAPNGCKAFLAELRQRQTKEEKEMTDAMLIAKHARLAMQATHDDLRDLVSKKSS